MTARERRLDKEYNERADVWEVIKGEQGAGRRLLEVAQRTETVRGVLELGDGRLLGHKLRAGRSERPCTREKGS